MNAPDWSIFRKRALAKIVTDESGCWLWTGSLDMHGYARIAFQGRNWRAMKVVWSAFREEEWPEGKFALHSCDVRKCVNPDHIRPGTNAENIKEAWDRGALSKLRMEAREFCCRGHRAHPRKLGAISKRSRLAMQGMRSGILSPLSQKQGVGRVTYQTTKLKTVEDEIHSRDADARALNIAQRIAAVMGEVDYVQKEKKQGMNYSIVSHDAVTAKVRPLLHKHGVIYYPHHLQVQQNGNRTEAMFAVRFENIDDRTDYIDVGTFGYGVDPQDKGPGKAMSYGVKYALLKVLGLETGDDPDTVQTPAANYQPANNFEERLPEDKGRGEGEMSSSALRASLRLLVHHINGASSVAELEDVLETEDAKEVVDNCKRRFPAWWETGESMPAEFVPLKKLIEQTRKGLKELETA